MSQDQAFTFIHSTESLDEFDTTGFWLYNQAEYINSKKLTLHHFYQLGVPEMDLQAYMNLYLDDRRAINGFESPFGDIEYTDLANETLLEQFILHVINYCRQRQCAELLFHPCPPYYAPEHFNLLDPMLTRQGFVRSVPVIAHYLPVVNGGFEETLHKMERRKLKKNDQAGVTCKIQENDQLKSVYDFICQCRRERNHSISLSFEKLQAQVQSNPDHYLLFTASLANEYIAACIAVLPGKQVLYNFYPASALAFNDLSPLVKLTAFI
jgi:hypothetical protein